MKLYVWKIDLNISGWNGNSSDLAIVVLAESEEQAREKVAKESDFSESIEDKQPKVYDVSTLLEFYVG